jgi:hypothetical protein
MKLKIKIAFLFAGLLALLCTIAVSLTVYQRVMRLWHRVGAPPTRLSRPSALPSRGSGASEAVPAPVPLVNHAMSQAFDEGFLPPPLKTATANPDDDVAELAKQIAARDGNSTPALLRGLQMAGFSVRHKTVKGFVVQADKGSDQGMAFPAWEVAAMAKLYDEEWTISLDDFWVVLTKCLPQFRKVSLQDQFLRAISNSSQGAQPLRAWSRLIIELGRHSGQPYDLTAANLDPRSVHLDAIQIALILERLSGDLRAADKGAATARTTAMYAGQQPALQDAVYHAGQTPRLVRVEDGSGGSPNPCSLSDAQATALDLGAIFQTTEWQNFVQSPEEGEASPEAQMNAVLTLVRFYLIYAGLHADINLDKSPLVRTKDLDQGEKGDLTTRVWFELGNWPELNCLLAFLRTALNLKQLDFGNLPNQGGVGGAGVSWFLTEGGVNTSIIPKDQESADLYNATRIVQFDGYGFDGLHTLQRQVTNDDGIAKINVWGAPQRKDLSHFKLVPVKKRFGVAIDVSFKGADPEKFVGELTDVIGPALGVASGDLLGGFAGAITEMLYRMSWRVDKGEVFPVQDWKICSKGWQGTITYAHNGHNVSTASIVVPNSGCCRITTQALDLKEQRTWIVSGSEGSYGRAQLASTWTGDYSRKQLEIVHQAGSSYWCKTTKLDARDEIILQGSDSGAANFSLVVNGSNFALILIPPVTPPRLALERTHTSYSNSQASSPNGPASQSYCEGSESSQEDTPSKEPWNFGFAPVLATLDPNHPEELQGSQTVPYPGHPDETITITWDLTHCEGSGQ